MSGCCEYVRLFPTGRRLFTFAWVLLPVMLVHFVVSACGILAHWIWTVLFGAVDGLFVPGEVVRTGECRGTVWDVAEEEWA